MPRLILLAAALFVVNLLVFKKPPYNNIENDQLQIMLEDDVPIYDVRRADEWYHTGIIEDSQLLTYVDANGHLKPDFLSHFTSEIDKDDPVILICRTGNRTGKLARYLVEKLGYTKVFNVDDGITRWISENRPTVRPMVKMKPVVTPALLHLNGHEA